MVWEMPSGAVAPLRQVVTDLQAQRRAGMIEIHDNRSPLHHGIHSDCRPPR